MITIIESKAYLESNTQAIVNFVDCSGNAINYDGEKLFEQYAEMFEKYKKFCDDNKFKPGMIWTYKHKNKIIFNFSISERKDNLNDVSLDLFRTSLNKLKELIVSKNIKSVAISNIPQIEHIDFNSIYDEIFYDTEFEVEVYNYKMICSISPEPMKQTKESHKINNSKITNMTYPQNTVFHI